MIPCTVAKDHLIFVPQNYAQIQSVLPMAKSVQVGGKVYVAVQQSLEAARVLRNMDIDAPSPIRTEYNWPIRAGMTPGWWQIDTAEFLTLYPRAFNLSTMRTRKTLSTLWAADYLIQKGVAHKVLVVAPLSTLERVWGDHLFFHFPHRRFAVLYGTAERRRRLLAEPNDFYIINHDGIEILVDEINQRTDINLVIIDESAVFRNNTNRYKAMKAVVTPERACWALTGTPTPQEPTDSYRQMKIVKPENFKGTFTRFKSETMMQLGPFKWAPRRGAEEWVKRLLSPAIRFTRDVVTDMEPTIIERNAELTEGQKKAVNEIIRKAQTEIDGSVVTAVNAAVMISKVTQAACGCVYDSFGCVVKLDFGPRLRVLEELIEENQEKVLVFVPFTGVLDALAKELKKKWSVAIVDGRTSANHRNAIFQDFQMSAKPHVLLAHPGTMAHGLELTAASLIIWYAPCNKNELFVQANARIDGGGQKAKIDIAMISATPTERRIYKALQEKTRLQDIILDMIKRGE
jgi:SNF2 family DNA or RNA helicase